MMDDDKDMCKCGKEKYKFLNLCFECNNQKMFEFEKAYALKNGGTSSESYIICPYCGEDYGTDDMRESCDVVCSSCNNGFRVEIEYTATYTTSK